MRNLLYLIFRFSAFFAFLILELLSLYLIVNYNKSQGEIWAHSSNLVVGSLNKRIQFVEDYANLRSVNDSLFKENAALLQTIINYRILSEDNEFQKFEETLSDSIRSYQLIPANICAKTVNLRNNYLTLCAGTAQGIKPGMGVITQGGVVGLVKNVSKNYATVLMVINSQSRISCKLKDKEYHGNLIWQNNDIRKMTLLDVPKHADIALGDLVVTSGYSVSFPKNIPLGKITNFDLTGGSNSFEIEVTLDYDLANIKNVYVVEFFESIEKDKLLSSEHE